MTRQELITKLDRVITSYCTSAAFQKTSEYFLKHFYSKTSARSSEIENMSLAALAQLGAIRISEFPFITDSQLKSLVLVFEELYVAYRSEEDTNILLELKQIEGASEYVMETLEGLREQLRKEQSDFCESPLTQKLQELLDQLKASLTNRTLGEKTIREFWPSNISQARNLQNMKLKELARMSVLDITMLRGVGERKIQGLTHAISSAINGNKMSAHVAENQTSEMRALDSQIASLKQSGLLDMLGAIPVQVFWGDEVRQSRMLSQMTFLEVSSYTARKLSNLPGIGRNKIEALAKAIELALAEYQTAQEAGATHPQRVHAFREQCDGRGVKAKTLPHSLRALQDLVEESKAKLESSNAPLAKLLARLSSTLDERELAVLSLGYDHPRREIAEILQVSESRVSQILGDSKQKLVALLERISGFPYQSWRKTLTEPAVKESDLLSSCIDRSGNVKLQELLGRLCLKALGAEQPTVFGKKLVGYWSLRPEKLEHKFNTLINSLPLSNRELSTRISALVPGISDAAAKEHIHDRLVYTSRIDKWTKDTRDALFYILQDSEQPMSSKELKYITNNSERYIRALLSKDSRVTKHGRNRGRLYSVKPEITFTGKDSLDMLMDELRE